LWWLCFALVPRAIWKPFRFAAESWAVWSHAFAVKVLRRDVAVRIFRQEWERDIFGRIEDWGMSRLSRRTAHELEISCRRTNIQWESAYREPTRNSGNPRIMAGIEAGGWVRQVNLVRVRPGKNLPER
jgi:hypothetical protein